MRKAHQAVFLFRQMVEALAVAMTKTAVSAVLVVAARHPSGSVVLAQPMRVTQAETVRRQAEPIVRRVAVVVLLVLAETLSPQRAAQAAQELATHTTVRLTPTHRAVVAVVSQRVERVERMLEMVGQVPRLAVTQLPIVVAEVVVEHQATVETGHLVV